MIEFKWILGWMKNQENKIKKRKYRKQGKYKTFEWFYIEQVELL